MKQKAIIYTTSHCKYCKDVKKFFDKISYPYETKDVEKYPEALAEMRTHTERLAVPTVVIGKKVFVGFDKELYTQFFIENGYTSDDFVSRDPNE